MIDAQPTTRKIIITKSKRGHYWLTVRDDQGKRIHWEKYPSLEWAKQAANEYR